MDIPILDKCVPNISFDMFYNAIYPRHIEKKSIDISENMLKLDCTVEGFASLFDL